MGKTIELSERAWEMLKKKPRVLTNQPLTREEVETILKEENFPLDHPIIPFQLTLAGYELTGYGGQLRLGITPDTNIYYRHGHWFCEIGEIIYPPSPVESILMDENGLIYCDESTLPLASKIEVLIESKALEEEMETVLGTTLYSIGESRISFEVLLKIEQSLLHLGLETVKESSDDYQHWWLGPDCYVHIFRNWYSDDCPIVIMANNIEKLRVLRAVLTEFIELPPYYLLKREKDYFTGKIGEDTPVKCVWPDKWPLPFNPNDFPFYDITTKVSTNKKLSQVIKEINLLF
jgi:hypothetical protein